MFEELTQHLSGAFRTLRGLGKLSEKTVDEALRDIRRALLEADVNYQVAKDFVERVREKAVGQEVLKSVTPAQLVIKIVHDELVQLLGETAATLNLAPLGPTVIMLVGLQGSGKTTVAGKLAKYLRSQGKKVLLVAADVYRPAAGEQLRLLGRQIQVPVYMVPDRKPVHICVQAVEEARGGGFGAVILDTAGRWHIDQEMMQELVAIRGKVAPNETLLVADAMTGQEAVGLAQEFDTLLNLDGVVLTKLDGDARGGAALSLRAVTGKPIKFVGLGEKLDALEPFYPDRMASRILGMGDVVTLVEKAQEAIDLSQQQKLEKKLRQKAFSLDDFLDQLRQLKKMGSLESILDLVPGFKLSGLQVDERALVQVEAIINSMTPQERENPKMIDGSRKKRIARGSGRNVQEVNQLLKQFSMIQKMVYGAGEKGWERKLLSMRAKGRKGRIYR
ncbi:MAG: signal recognition particle [candidate division Zixibacteria bacterium SM23_81]|nr:MAG: signal recognition particle [candidate division Zixibacteria bacterium SM23_81]